MTIHFNNKSSHTAVLTVDDDEQMFLRPFETATVVRKDSDVIKTVVKCNGESAVSKEKFNSKSIVKTTVYHLEIETEYFFSGISEGEIFTISHERIRFSRNAAYNRLFLFATNASYHSEAHKVISEKKIKKAFNKPRLMDIFIFDLLFASPGLSVVLLVVGISLTFIWGKRLAFVYFPIAYLFLVSFNWLIGRLVEVVFKRAFKVDDEKKEFYSYFGNEFIKNYYSNTERTPFVGEIEID